MEKWGNWAGWLPSNLGGKRPVHFLPKFLFGVPRSVFPTGVGPMRPTYGT